MALDRYWPEVRNIFSFVVANRTMYGLNAVGVAVAAFVSYFIWTAVYDQGASSSELARAEMVTYIFVAYFFNVLTGFGQEFIIADGIRTGEIVKDLVLPQTYQGKHLAAGIGWLSGMAVFAAVPTLTLGVLAFGVSLPAMHTWPFLAVSLVLAVCINYGLSFLLGCTAFWLGSVWGVAQAKQTLATLAGGALIPIYLMPAWLQSAVRFLPFHASMHIPTSIYMGKAVGWAAMQALGVQALWAAGLLIAGHYLFAYASRHVTVQGG